MGKRAAATCQHPQVSQRPRRRRKKTPDDVAAASGLSSCTCCSATSQAERRPRQQGKNPNTARRLLRSCATATATAQARLRRHALSVSWGGKRSRTVRSGPALGSRWRDWAGLDEGPASLIADRVLANDVADYVRFRAACLPWRRRCADPRTRGVLEDPRLYPRQWIMLRDDYEELATAAAPHRRFLNTRTGQCVQVDVPELPPTTGFLEYSLGCIGECMPSCAGLLDHLTVYLYFYSRHAGTMAIARPGDDRWVLLNTGPELIECTVFFAGRFYGVTASGILVTVDMAGDDRGPRLVVAAERPKPFTFSSMTDTVHLVDNDDGDLRLVHRMLRPRMYRVYRVNFSTGKTTTRGRRNLGGHAMFIDLHGGLSVSPRVFPFLRADTIYLGLHCDERSVGKEQIGAYHVRDGSIEPPCNDDSQRRGLAHPLSIADSLIAYVSG
ncbi:unnamed protein product [Miscanthus lutarioriparius]|uniref:KIB1-4 beta-propeller domain-containing protein n=1 Tax=Miscanthus lutarioriparius TaxID=422564 RepID=A0A811PNM7_9POAL|nr:unnamed protein product [Miscanthus lutarioriparius]